MGILSFVNHLSTHSKLNIQPILNRLITAIIDFYYLMFSTILGCMFGLLYFINKYPSIKDYEALYELSIKGVVTIGIVGTITTITTQYLNNKNKVLH